MRFSLRALLSVTALCALWFATGVERRWVGGEGVKPGYVFVQRQHTQVSFLGFEKGWWGPTRIMSPKGYRPGPAAIEWLLEREGVAHADTLRVVEAAAERAELRRPSELRKRLRELSGN